VISIDLLFFSGSPQDHWLFVNEGISEIGEFNGLPLTVEGGDGGNEGGSRFFEPRYARYLVRATIQMSTRIAHGFDMSYHRVSEELAASGCFLGVT